MDTAGNGVKQELQMEKIAYRVVKEHLAECPMRRDITNMSGKLDGVLDGIGTIRVDIGVMQTDIKNIRETVKDNMTARTGQLTWFQRTVVGAVWVAVIGGVLAGVFKIAQAVAGG